MIALLYAVGFGAKESAVTLPGLVFLLDAVRRDLGPGDIRDYVRRRWPVYLGLAFVAVMLLSARYMVLGSIANPLAPMGGELLREIPRIWTLGEIWLHYVRLWVFPLDLSADYSPGVIPISLGWGLANSTGVALVLLFLALALYSSRKPTLDPRTQTARTLTFGAVWFLIAMSPVSNTVFLSGVLLAERTLYLPSVGLAAATGWLVLRLTKTRPRGAWVLLFLFVGLASIRTWTRNPTWLDNPTMLATLIRDYPQSGRSQWVIGDALMRQERISEGLLSYRLAIDRLGTHYQLLAEISEQLMRREGYSSAETLSRFAAEQEPHLPRAWSQLAMIRAEHGDAEATEEFARRSLALTGNDPTRHHLLAWSLAAQGRLDEAADARAVADRQGRAVFWHRHLYEAYLAQAAGDSATVRIQVDSAATRAFTAKGRAAVDSIRVTDFDLPSARDP